MATPQTVYVAQDGSHGLTLAGTDAEAPLTFAIAAAVQAPSPLAPSYLHPAAGYAGADSFTFTVNDGTSDSDPATVTLVVDADSTAPVVATPTVAFGTGRVNESAPLKISWSATDAGVGRQALHGPGQGRQRRLDRRLHRHGRPRSRRFYPFDKSLVWRVRASDNNDNVSALDALRHPLA